MLLEPHRTESCCASTDREGGFTLIEVLVAMLILSGVAITFLTLRTNALIGAAEARNWRIAREIAATYLSELQAGARELPPEPGQIYTIEDYDAFEYEIFVGEAAISDMESRLADQSSMASPDGSSSASERLAWQRERESLRRARSSGMSLLDYQDQQRAEELEQRIPAEDEFEDVAVLVWFPQVRPSEEDLSERGTFVLKAKISTMALEGLTPERAAVVAEQRGGGTDSGGDTAGIGGMGDSR